MLLYKNTKAIVCSTNDKTNFFDIVDRVLQGDTLVPYIYYLRRLHILSINRFNKIKCFHYKKAKSRGLVWFVGFMAYQSL